METRYFYLSHHDVLVEDRRHVHQVGVIQDAELRIGECSVVRDIVADHEHLTAMSPVHVGLDKLRDVKPMLLIQRRCEFIEV